MPKNTSAAPPVWVYPKKDPIWVQEIIHEFNIHPVTAQILATRGFTSLEAIHNYLYAKLPNLYDPSLFKDMDKAVNRILTAIENREGILIYGDNDVDGMTAAALLTEYLLKLNAKAYYFVPNSNVGRTSLITDGLPFALSNDCSLLITVDCGITARKEIKEIVNNNIDVIITDHHEPTSKIPHCIATLNPKLVNSTYPNREITGVGVAFKLAHALTNKLVELGKIKPHANELKQYLDLVAMGTISDMGALVGENRILVRYGLKQLAKTKRVGLQKLFRICEMNLTKITPVDVASKLAPRLNSLGRIADPRKGVELLLIRDEKEAAKLALELDIYNVERQKIERHAADDIEKTLEQDASILNEKAIVLYSNKWHPGIIPIITARIAKHYNRPTMLIAIENGIGKGSIRTIPEFPLLPLLKANEEILINFGGHDFAAGLTIDEKNIPQLKESFIHEANELLSERDVQSKLYLDAPINFADLTFDFMESFSLLEPFGNENPPPILYCDAVQTWPPKVVGKTHLKLYLEQNDRTLEGIGFGMAGRKDELREKNMKLRIAFSPHINTFMNKTSIQLRIIDFQAITD